ncbi:MAG: sugar-binding domain-containing protein [Roseiflexaceae bacterium]
MHRSLFYPRMRWVSLMLLGLLLSACSATSNQPTLPPVATQAGATQPALSAPTVDAPTTASVPTQSAATDVPTAQPATGWQPKQAPLMTRWAAQVDPEHVLPEYPRPQLVRPDWQSLNGEWQFAATSSDAQPPFGQELAERILVPFPVESALSGIMRSQSRMWYRRNFSVPAAWAGRNLLLNFGAVDWQATVYLNGAKVGEHTGGYDAFSLDVTQQIQPGANELIVGVFDPSDTGTQPVGKQRAEPKDIWYTAVSGIWQTVWIEPVAAASIARLDLTPDLLGQALKLTVQGMGTSDQTVEVVALDGGTEVGRAIGAVGAEISIPVPNPKQWTPEQPFLYDLKVVLKQGDQGIDEVTSYFGMRSIGLAKVGQYLRPVLNGQFVFQLGLLDQGFWPDGIYTAPTDEALRYDIEQAKALGYNLLRKHVKVEPQRWYYWADKLGILVWQDMPSMPDYKKNLFPEAKQQFELELKELIDEHRSAPSIVMWVPFNEGWGEYEAARIADTIKQWDPSRLVNNASGWDDADAGDVIDRHEYVGPSTPRPSETRAAVLGEFGGLGLKVAGHEWNPGKSFNYEMQSDAAHLDERYLGLIGRLPALMELGGLSAAVYTQLTDVETEVNGIMTYDRAQIKFDQARLKAAHEQVIMASRQQAAK